MDLSTRSIVELKAMGYDQLAIMENAQKNLGAINQELASRRVMADKEPGETTPEKDEEGS